MWKGADILVKCIKNEFKNVKPLSNSSRSISVRENDPEEFLKRITPQILECYDNGYTYETPEEWDKYFYLLGGGQGRRTSETILKRMRWDQFLYNSELIIKEFRLT